MAKHSILADIVRLYSRYYDRYEQAMRRGDFERADESFSVVQEIEACVHINEVSTKWRDTIAKINKQEAEARG